MRWIACSDDKYWKPQISKVKRVFFCGPGSYVRSHVEEEGGMPVGVKISGANNLHGVVHITTATSATSQYNSSWQHGRL